MLLSEYLVRSAECASEIQSADGSMPAGHNGPWLSQDTPVRTTAHWSVLFAYAYKHTGRRSFKKYALSACNYLVSSQALPEGNIFLCRSSSNAKDQSNGLIGQAWAIEALLYNGDIFGRKEFIEIADLVLNNHRYCKERHGWYEKEVGGIERGFCSTINQQIWFAVMALDGGKRCSRLKSFANDFFGHLPDIIEFQAPGIIRHVVRPRKSPNRSIIEKKISDLIALVKRFSLKEPAKCILQERALGYQSFILYALAIAESLTKQNYLSDKPGYEDLLDTTLRSSVCNLTKVALEDNPYAWSYNPVGIELAYAIQTFAPHIDLGERAAEYWLKQQLLGHASLDPPLLNQNTTDPVILAARLYEATRLDPNINVSNMLDFNSLPLNESK